MYKERRFGRAMQGSGKARGEHDCRLRWLRPTPIEIGWSLVGKNFPVAIGGRNLIRELWFLTDQPTERPKTNSTVDSGEFARLRPNLVEIRSKKISGDSRRLLLSDPNQKLRFSTDLPTEHSHAKQLFYYALHVSAFWLYPCWEQYYTMRDFLLFNILLSKMKIILDGYS